MEVYTKPDGKLGDGHDHRGEGLVKEQRVGRCGQQS